MTKKEQLEEMDQKQFNFLEALILGHGKHTPKVETIQEYVQYHLDLAIKYEKLAEVAGAGK